MNPSCENACVAKCLCPYEVCHVLTGAVPARLGTVGNCGNLMAAYFSGVAPWYPASMLTNASFLQPLHCCIMGFGA